MTENEKLAAEIGLEYGAETSGAKPRVLGRPFQKGNRANPHGRPKGSRNKLSEDFLRALSEDFAHKGLAAIKKVRQNRPQDYLKVLASVLPKQVDVTIDPIEQLTEADLERHLAGLLQALSDRVEEGSLAGRASLAAKELEKQARTLSSLH